MHNLAKR